MKRDGPRPPASTVAAAILAVAVAVGIFGVAAVVAWFDPPLAWLWCALGGAALAVGYYVAGNRWLR